jgi:hypothetical protein
LFAGGEREIRGGEIFDRTVWPKQCTTGNRHRIESSREKTVRFHDRLVAKGSLLSPEEGQDEHSSMAV